MFNFDFSTLEGVAEALIIGVAMIFALALFGHVASVVASLSKLILAKANSLEAQSTFLLKQVDDTLAVALPKGSFQQVLAERLFKELAAYADDPKDALIIKLDELDNQYLGDKLTPAQIAQEAKKLSDKIALLVDGEKRKEHSAVYIEKSK